MDQDGITHGIVIGPGHGSNDPVREIIGEIRGLISGGAANSLNQLRQRYREDEVIRALVDEWMEERGLSPPRDDAGLREILRRLLSEQLYTYAVRMMFYSVLTSNPELDPLAEARNPEAFLAAARSLFAGAIEATGDFEEVFGPNLVDRLPLMPASVGALAGLARYIQRIRWSEMRVDVMGRVFESLIHEERRRLLGQHYTDARVVDVILGGAFRINGGRPGRLLDPACGSGAFLTRALNYWRVMRAPPAEVIWNLEGVDVDKLAAMLAKVNLYVQALEAGAGAGAARPAIMNDDFFAFLGEPDQQRQYLYVVANPPYTRQEEMALAHRVQDYKSRLADAVRDVPGWSKRASIHAYFLVGGGKLLQQGGALGFIMENSWLNADYGGPLRRWLWGNFDVLYVIESLVEQWFEDAAINTNIVIARRGASGAPTRFIFLKRGLEELVGPTPPTSDFAANRKYYERIEGIYARADRCTPGSSGYAVAEDEDMRVVCVQRDLLMRIEDRLGKLGIFRGPAQHIDLLLRFVEGGAPMVPMGRVVELRSGLKTKANDVFYLPSRYWFRLLDSEGTLQLGYGMGGRSPTLNGARKLVMEKEHLRRLIRLGHLEGQPYRVTNPPPRGRDDYVVWIPSMGALREESGAYRYLRWALDHMREAGSKEYLTLRKQIGSAPDGAFKLPDTSGGDLLLRGAIYRNYGAWLLDGDARRMQVDACVYVGTIRGEYRGVDRRVVFASVNSAITYLSVELMGRTNLGEGALDVEVDDYERVPIIDPRWLEEELRKRGQLEEFLASVDSMLRRPPRDVEVEARMGDRLAVERMMLGAFGIGDVDRVYRALVELAKMRCGRAKSRLATA
ncbi:MAG: HsdM family class I SAM-dependent methyltransferase [Conexivisphaera sp.]